MGDWNFAQENSFEHLCKLHLFAMKNKAGVEFTITVREYITPPDPSLRFFAQADKQTNQKTALTSRPGGETASSVPCTSA